MRIQKMVRMPQKLMEKAMEGVYHDAIPKGIPTDARLHGWTGKRTGERTDGRAKKRAAANTTPKQSRLAVSKKNVFQLKDARMLVSSNQFR